MKALHLLAATGAASVLLAFAAGNAGADPPAGGVPIAPRSPPPPPPAGMNGFHDGFHDGFHRGFHGGGFLIVEEPQVVVERDVVHEVVEEVPAPPPPPPRERYVIGRSYSSLPSGCMKMIDLGVSYYRCNGEWYREGRAGYIAVAQP